MKEKWRFLLFPEFLLEDSLFPQSNKRVVNFSRKLVLTICRIVRCQIVIIYIASQKPNQIVREIL